MEDNGIETRQERRERKLQSRRERIKKHGKNLAALYKTAIAKRIDYLRNRKEKDREL